MSEYKKINVPSHGKRITVEKGKLIVPNNHILAFIEGDGTGPDIWRASKRVFDSAVDKAYMGNRKIAWMEIYAGEKALSIYGKDQWLPDETVDAIQ